MCDIEYEEFDNKESIYQELKSMMKENAIFISPEQMNENNKPNILKESEIPIEILETLEDNKTIRMSDLYSNFSSLWKYKLKARQNVVDCSITSTDVQYMKSNEIDEHGSDVSDIEIDRNESKNEKSKIGSKKVLVETGSCSFNEESITLNDPVIKQLSTGKMVVSSTQSNFEKGTLNITEILPVNKSTPVKKIYVESSCDSLNETPFVSHRKLMNKAPVSRNVAVASFGCSFGEETPQEVQKNEMATSSTETENYDKPPNQSSFGSQANEIFESLEQKILPFIRSANTVELKLKGRLSVFQFACVKQIAIQHELMIKKFGKGPDSFILLRKKIGLLSAQKEFLEKKKAELTKQKERVASIKAKEQKLLNPPKKVSTSCQVDFLSEEKISEKIFMSKNEARRNRKKQWQLKEKQKLKKNSSSQTIENGFYVCPYCEDDIPESLQFVHYPHCLEKYRSKTQSQFKAGDGINISKSNRKSSHHKVHRSKSCDRVHQSKIDSLKKELEKVHDNDINAIMNIVAELDKKCIISGCNKRKTKTCSECCSDLCANHYSPDDNNNNNKHFNCPVILEKLNAERQKKLGSNNPLLKTIEQLQTPKFSDGAMIKRTKRVKLVEKSDGEENFISNQIFQNGSANINQTRTRNGPMLSFERNHIKKHLQEKISLMIDKRSK